MRSMDAARLLVVEDDQQVADVVVYVLEKAGFKVERAADGKAGLEAFRRRPPDLVVLDLNLPLLSGQMLFHEMRHLQPDVPVIMLTARSETNERIIGLEMGADDYISKPFDNHELTARIHAVLRRCLAGQKPKPVIHQGPVEINTEAVIFKFFDQRVDLTRQEFELMKALAGSPTRTFSRDDLISRMYDNSHPVTDRTVDACIKRIRQKLQLVHADADPIRTLYGIGYKFNEELLSQP